MTLNDRDLLFEMRHEISEREREAIMRLTMCARRNCAICIYGHNRKRATVKLPQSCLDRITENMNILAAALQIQEKEKEGMQELEKRAKCLREWHPAFSEYDCFGCVHYRLLRKTKCALTFAKANPENIPKLIKHIKRKEGANHD